MKYIIKEEENKKKTFEVSEKFRLLLPILLLVFSAVLTAVNVFVRLPIGADVWGIIFTALIGLIVSGGIFVCEYALKVNSKFAIIISACNFVFFMLGIMGGAVFELFYLIFGVVGAVAIYLVNFDFQKDEWKESKRVKTLAILGLAAIVVIVAASLFVQRYEDGIVYRINGDGYQVISAANATSLEVKSEINGKPVTSVKAYAFGKNTFTKKLVLPLSITKIERFAFTGMGAIEELTLNPGALPGGMLYAAWGAADTDIQYLSDKYIPHSLAKVTVLASVPESCFAFMFQLKEIHFSEDTGKVKTIGANAFVYCVGLTDVRLPSTMLSIGDYAFAYCSGLRNEQVRKEDGTVKTEDIGGRQVTVYTNEGMVLNDKLVKIGNYAFLKCGSLREVIIPGSVKDVGSYIFDRCSFYLQIRIKNTQSGIILVEPARNEDYTLSSNISGWSNRWQMSATETTEFDQYGLPLDQFTIGNIVYNPETAEI